MSGQHPNRRAFVTGILAAASSFSTGCNDFSLMNQEKAEAFLERFTLGLNFHEPIEGGWRLSDAVPPRAGAVILNLSHDDGRTLRVDVCRRGNRSFGPVFTGNLDLIVMDGGGGSAIYEDELQIALMVLAETLQQNEYVYRLSESLLSHTERLKAFPGVMSRAAHELIPTPVLLDTFEG